jgi:hypothetical protein
VKYAYVIGIGRDAIICFAEPTGCHREAVTAEPVMMTMAGGRTAIDSGATRGTAFAKAVAQLGEAGWQMVGSGPAYADGTTEQALHFKLSR